MQRSYSVEFMGWEISHSNMLENVLPLRFSIFYGFSTGMGKLQPVGLGLFNPACQILGQNCPNYSKDGKFAQYAPAKMGYQPSSH